MMTNTPNHFSEFDVTMMRSLLDDAMAFRGLTSPNPMVGAALVRDGELLAKGVHQAFGAAHAERQLFEGPHADVSGATLYVTLEPCTHYGKTPPCSDLILDSGISRLVIGALDPNPAIENLYGVYQDKGIRVEIGCLAEEAIVLNEVYYKRMLFERPFVTMKTASTLDGRIATASGESCYITSESSRKQCHDLRREADAIIVGVETVIADDPSLTVRYGRLDGGYQSPKVVILDTQLRTPITSTLFSGRDAESVLIVTAADDAAWAPYSGKATRVPVATGDYVQRWQDLLGYLYKDGIYHVLIEGGATVFSSAMAAGIVDRYHAFLAPSVMNDGGGMPVMKGPKKEALSQMHTPNHRQVLECGDDIWVNSRYYSPKMWLDRLGHDD